MNKSVINFSVTFEGAISLAGNYFHDATISKDENEIDRCMTAGACLLSAIEIPDEPSSAFIDLRKPTFPCTKKDKQEIAGLVYKNLMRALSTIGNDGSDEETINFVIKARQAYNTMYGLN